MKGRRVVWNEGSIRRRISKTGRVNITTKALATGRLFQTAAAVVSRPAWVVVLVVLVGGESDGIC